MRGIHSAFATALLSLLAACSPYSYSKEIGTMSDGVNTLSSAFGAGFDGLASDRNAKAQIEILDGHASGGRIAMSPSCLDSSLSDPCLLYPANQKPPKQSKAEELRDETRQALKVLKDYANALAAVTNAADRSAYDAAVGQLAGAVGSLTSVANKAAPGASAAVSAGINIFGWLVGTALDEQRFDTLKKAVSAVGLPVRPEKPPFPEDSDFRRVTLTLGLGLDAIKRERQQIVEAEVRQLVNGLNFRTWSEEAYAKRLANAQTALAAATALRKSDPEGAASDLADAHDKLVAAVRDPKKSYTAFMKAVGDFADKVAATEAALKALSPGAPARKGS